MRRNADENPERRGKITAQLYLTIPSTLSPDRLASVLDAVGAACIRCISEAGETETLTNLREVCHDRDLPIVIETRDAQAVDLAKRHGLDGVHIDPAPKTIAYARKSLGENAIVGVGAGTSCHDGMVAAEAGADYIAFGPVSDIDPEFLGWWARIVETPLVAEVASPEQAQSLAEVADFICLSADVWEEKSPVKTIRAHAPRPRTTEPD